MRCQGLAATCLLSAPVGATNQPLKTTQSPRPLSPTLFNTNRTKTNMRRVNSAFAGVLLLAVPAAVHGSTVVCNGEGLEIQPGLWGVDDASLQSRVEKLAGTLWFSGCMTRKYVSPYPYASRRTLAFKTHIPMTSLCSSLFSNPRWSQPHAERGLRPHGR
jgi:hypothetical protein